MSTSLVLPHKLKRPQFVLFRGFTLVFFPILALLALMREESALGLVVLMGGSLWWVLGFVLLVNWQVVTLHEKHLTFVVFGRTHTAIYEEIRAVKASRGARGVNGPTALPTLEVHRAGTTKPLKINLANIGEKDRVMLAQFLKERAPGAQFDALAKQMVRGVWSG